jgi:hypothetical protein
MITSAKADELIARLPAYTAQIVADIIKTGVTPELIVRAGNAPDEEWQRYQILRILGGGNPAHLDTLTDLAMDEIRIALEEGELT